MLLFLLSLGAFLFLLAYVYQRYRKPYIDNFTSKSVFITGTDSGFGKTLALHLDKCGVKVYAGCYTKEGCDMLKKDASDRLKPIPIDITKVESVDKAKEAIEKDLGPSQVNNAGLCTGELIFPLVSIEDYTLAMDVNFFGTMNVTNAFWPLIKKSSGRIINVISMAGRCSSVMEPYTCSKFALEPYTDGLRRWMRNFGAHVAIIEPGVFTYTNLNNNILTIKTVEDYKKKTLPNRMQECGENFFEAALKDMRAFEIQFTQFNHPAMVTNAMEHGLFAKHPKDRYVCGVDANFYRMIPAIVPDWAIDFFIRFFTPHIRHHFG